MEGGTDHDLRTLDVISSSTNATDDNDEDGPKQSSEKSNNDETNSKKSSDNKVIDITSGHITLSVCSSYILRIYSTLLFVDIPENVLSD